MKTVVVFRDHHERKLKQEYSNKAHVDYILLCLYTYLPPLRGSEYLNCKYSLGPHTVDNIAQFSNNLLDIANHCFWMQHYKTVKEHGIRRIEIPDMLYNILMEYYNRYHFEYLLGKLISPALLASRFNNIFGCKISVNMLRKIYVSEKVNEMTVKERKVLAFIMAHNLETQEMIYHRFGQNHS